VRHRRKEVAMLRRVSFALFVCACAILAFVLPVRSGQLQAVPAALTAPPLTGGPDAFGYTWDRRAPFQWIDTASGAQVPGGDGICRGPYDIGFAFDFYGVSYTEFNMDTEGFVAFMPNCSFYGEWVNGIIPHRATPNSIVAPFWDDLKPVGTAILRFQTLGAAPHRYLVVEWNGVGHRSDFDHPMTFQVIFYEGSHNIKFQYLSMTANSRGDAHEATIGIENQNGTIGLSVSYNQGWLTDGTAILFTHPSVQPTRTPGGRRVHLPLMVKKG